VANHVLQRLARFAHIASMPDVGHEYDLARLAARRLDRFRPVLSEAVDGHEEKSAALAGRLHEVDSRRRQVIHGDMIPANILVDDAGSPSAVLTGAS
jgi:aminoglycoside phosphotransferase (APT) family kinase protein